MKEKIARRAFQTEWFAKAAGKANITDAELCRAIMQVIKGQCDDLGGGVFKKRLDKNMQRSIIVAKGDKYWVYAFLFAKKTAPISIAKSWKASENWQTCMETRQMMISLKN
jgi:hypothetical protein